MNGIIPLNKPRGMTSFDCVSKIRKIVHMKKVGHSGTLDPNVDGVLPICLGNATKVVDFLMASGKRYRGEITLGFATTTEDLDGEVIESTPILKPFSEEVIQTQMNQLISAHLKQIPPMYSAIKVNGRKLYEYARAGETVERPVRDVRVDDFRLVGKSHYDKNEQVQRFNFEVICGKGTYVRTLAIMLGRLLRVAATMTSLTRTQSGHFNLDQTYTLDQVRDFYEHDQLKGVIYPLSHALNGFPVHDINDAEWRLVQNGGFIDAQPFSEQPQQVVLNYHGDTKALYELDGSIHKYRPLKMFSNK